MSGRAPGGARRGLGARLAVSVVACFVVLGSLMCLRRPEIVEPQGGPALPVLASAREDTTHKEELRLLPAEVYVRSYLQWFGGLAPLEVQEKARGADRDLLFDTWADYLSALGMPDYAIDLPRGAQTNALMLGAFERLGAALCARALEHDLRGKPPVSVSKRIVYAFDPGPGAPSAEEFARGFDVLHRTFLGYPSKLAPAERLPRYHRLFDETRSRQAQAGGRSPDAAAHAAADAKPGGPKSRLSPVEAGWVAVCEGLVRHPELHFY